MRHQLPGPAQRRAVVSACYSGSREREVTQLDVDLVAECGVGQAAMSDEVGYDALALPRQRRVKHVPVYLPRHTNPTVNICAVRVKQFLFSEALTVAYVYQLGLGYIHINPTVNLYR